MINIDNVTHVGADKLHCYYYLLDQGVHRFILQGILQGVAEAMIHTRAALEVTESLHHIAALVDADAEDLLAHSVHRVLHLGVILPNVVLCQACLRSLGNLISSVVNLE